MTMYIDLRELGQRCQEYRKRIGIRQIDVAGATGYTVKNISAFENGRNDNARILLFYIGLGLTYNEIIWGLDNAKKNNKR